MSSPTPKYYPRGQDTSPVVNGGASPSNNYNPMKSPGRFSAKSNGSQYSPSRSVVGERGALLVDGMGRSPAKRGGCTSVFRSSTSTADAHIKALSTRFNGQSSFGSSSYSASPRGGGTAAFRSTSPSDRDSHIRGLSSRAYAAGGGSRSNSPNSPNRNQMPSAAFRSKSPTACAHIKAMIKPTDASYGFGSSSNSRSATSWAKSGSSIADAHIKAMTKPTEHSTGLLSPNSARGATNVFRSQTSIADAHIKALNKPVDQLVSYREIQDQ